MTRQKNAKRCFIILEIWDSVTLLLPGGEVCGEGEGGEGARKEGSGIRGQEGAGSGWSLSLLMPDFLVSFYARSFY